MRSQIKDGEVKDVTHLEPLGVLKERISILEQEQVLLRCTHTRAQKVIKDLEDGISLPSAKWLVTREELQKVKDSQETGSQSTPRKRKRGNKSDGGLYLPTPEIRRTFGSLGDINCSPSPTLNRVTDG